MRAKIKLSHSNSHWRGKEGLVVGWSVPEKKAYTYSMPELETKSGRDGVIYIRPECMKVYSSAQPDLVKRGFVERVETYNAGKAAVRVYIETVNETSPDGCQTLMAPIWPGGYSAVEVSEDDIESVSFDDETRSAD